MVSGVDIEQFCLNLDLLLDSQNVKRVGLSVSGGIDSMCLCHLSQFWSARKGIDLTCLVVDHKLRQESSVEAEYVVSILESYGLRAKILPIFWNKPLSNIQKAAREARYDLLTKYCQENGLEYLFTGHNKDDQAETVLMRISRGSGVNGAIGIPTQTILNGIKIIRPLLPFHRHQICYTISKAGWSWVEDKSNQNQLFERVKIRTLFSQLSNKELWINRLALFADNMNRVRTFIDQEVDSCFYRMCNINIYGFIFCEHLDFCALHEEIALKLLSKIINKFNGGKEVCRLASLLHLYKNIKAQQILHKTLGGVEIVKKKDKILFYRELRSVESSKHILPNAEITWDNRFVIELETPLTLKVTALGKNGQNLLRTDFDHQGVEPPNSLVLSTTPGIFDTNGNLVCYPHLGITKADVKIKSFRCLWTNE
ncbi:tRNA lysidine(34) synthetase TilS [Rickettsiales endosymbiont of Peranema trichophorum]|uniref:tRNA lysidine(34) synthetase TilS n=1 Tax=Rickettsiales endosymbiont of Peranema trichophorum TaxID=2486577 RepID=UPI001022FEA6|nr:tRNA lysidine(34) synthetase TilS [Rickettsiales endosymbiont of Peranema trichophorum]RZI47215.1 tRNA lysidine(34) synthetase TilS [Rickettsiales endosymbiont of Peranema trichophorum]